MLRRTADGKGDAVLATRPFSAGDTVMVGFLSGPLTANDSHATQVGPNRWARHGGLGPKVNHSCDPNCGVRLNDVQAYDFVARREIDTGQELTFDYAMRNFTIDHFPVDVPVRRRAVPRLGHGLEGSAGHAQGRLRRARRAVPPCDGRRAGNRAGSVCRHRDIRTGDDDHPPPRACRARDGPGSGRRAHRPHYPVSHAARARARPTTCDISGVADSLGPTSVTSLKVLHVRCGRAIPVVRAFHSCRLANGPSGRCVRLVRGYACGEIRSNGPTQFTSTTTCRKDSASIVHRYTQVVS